MNLLIHYPSGTLARYPLDLAEGEQWTFGVGDEDRTPSYRVPETSVHTGRIHITIIRRGEDWFLRDTSANGTKLQRNGKEDRIHKNEKEKELSAGDWLTIPSHAVLRDGQQFQASYTINLLKAGSTTAAALTAWREGIEPHHRPVPCLIADPKGSGLIKLDLGNGEPSEVKLSPKAGRLVRHFANFNSSLKGDVWCTYQELLQVLEMGEHYNGDPIADYVSEIRDAILLAAGGEIKRRVLEGGKVVRPREVSGGALTDNEVKEKLVLRGEDKPYHRFGPLGKVENKATTLIRAWWS